MFCCARTKSFSNRAIRVVRGPRATGRGRRVTRFVDRLLCGRPTVCNGSISAAPAAHSALSTWPGARVRVPRARCFVRRSKSGEQGTWHGAPGFDPRAWCSLRRAMSAGTLRAQAPGSRPASYSSAEPALSNLPIATSCRPASSAASAASYRLLPGVCNHQ
jgi:hypothetical protein